MVVEYRIPYYDIMWTISVRVGKTRRIVQNTNYTM